MKRMIAVAFASASLVLAGHGALRAAGQPQCDPAQGAASGQQPSGSANLAEEKKADAQKFQTAEVNSANKACEDVSAPGKDGSSGKKQ